MTVPVRYVRSGDNAALRLAVYEQWRYRCYWCTRPKDYTEVDLDHIVPQTNNAAALARVRRIVGWSFDIDGPENLAPICGPCNVEKSNQDLTRIPALMTKLKTARDVHLG